MQAASELSTEQLVRLAEHHLEEGKAHVRRVIEYLRGAGLTPDQSMTLRRAEHEYRTRFGDWRGS